MVRNFLLATAVAFSVGLPATAQEWSGQVTPYIWVPGIGGDITPFTGAPQLSFDTSISEVLKDTDGAFFVTGLIRRDRLVFVGDLSMSSSSKSGILPPGLPAEGKLKQRSLTLLAGWNVSSDDKMTLDLLAGARAWKIAGSVSIAGGAIQASGDESFVDPIVAVRANVSLAPRWSTILYADIGGFGVGSDSTSQILATVNYQLKDNIWFSAGYRHLHVDYSSGGTELNATMAGPLLGVTWQF